MTSNLQTEHEDPNYEVRTIFLKKESGVEHKTVLEKAGAWTWKGLKQIKKYSTDAIGYLSRNAQGYLEVQIKKNSNVPKEQLVQALLQHVGIDPQKLDAAVWNEIPGQIATEIGSSLARSCKVAQKQVYTSSEGKILGAVFAIEDIYVANDWKIKFSNVEFSSVAKEPSSGNDVAVLLHVTDGKGRSAIKTIWFQAKKDATDTKNEEDHLTLAAQLEMMKSITEASYPLFLTQGKIYVKETLDGSKEVGFDKFIAEAVRCKYGDRRKEIYAESLDRSTIFEVAIKKIKKPKKIQKNKIRKVISKDSFIKETERIKKA